MNQRLVRDHTPPAHRHVITHSELHYHIIRSFVDHGYAPRVDELAVILQASADEVRAALIALQDYHGVVLHPASMEIWVAHPFSAAPTNFWVQADRTGCWANCAWCAMGAVTLLGGTATVTSTLGAEVKQVVLHIRDGVLQPNELHVHFPVPMARAWDNVIYTCSTMLLFESEAQVQEWCRRHRIAQGSIQSLDIVLAFARDWYGRHLDRDWRKWSAAQAVALFERHGLTDPIWQIAAEARRF